MFGARLSYTCPPAIELVCPSSLTDVKEDLLQVVQSFEDVIDGFELEIQFSRRLDVTVPRDRGSK